MVNYNIASWILWAVLIFVFALIGLLYWFIMIIHKRNTMDMILMIDKDYRWKMHYKKLYGKDDEIIDKRKYVLQDKCGLLNTAGKVLYLFFENKPQPLKILHGKDIELNAESLHAITENKLIKKVISPSDDIKDSMLLFGAIGGMIAGLASIVILLIQLGVLKT